MAVVEVDRPEPDIIRITMNRPASLNALNQEMVDGLWAAIDEVR